MIGLLLKSNSEGPNMLHKNILIVEDEYITALDIKTQLLSVGNYRFEIAGTGEEAVWKALENPIDLVLMDIKLKGEMDGIEAAQKIKKKRNIPLIYISGNLDTLDPKRLERTKPERILRKPISEQKLRNVVTEVLR
ncbi:MAG: response regulator [Candidatus Aminicenantes bacterium]|nr:response regulator [Candidatus Aminicenantes bacterium]